MKAKDIVNWGAVSTHLTGRNDVIRENRVSKKHKQSVDELLKLIQAWIDNDKVFTRAELEENINDLDLIALIIDKQ